jgi:glycosyltransferase involved in cell wall biosynthesis
MTKGTLALLIPAYNSSPYLSRLFKSIAEQTQPFDEVWLYDDCSSDDTVEVARGYGAKVVRGTVNMGCSHAKNTLASMTTCDWLHFHDADDEILPQFVEHARAWIARDEHDVVVFGSMEREHGTGRFMAQAVHDNDALAADAVRYTISTKISANAGIYRRTAFLAAGGFDTDRDVLYNEDVAMHCSLARAGLRFAAEPTVLMVNWRRPGSMSSDDPSKCLRAHYRVMLKALEHDKRNEYHQEIAESLWDNATSAAALLDWPTADASGRLAFRLGGRPRQQSRLFRKLCLLGPRNALRLREWLIRLLKPRYRAGFQGWRLRW